MRTQDCEYSGSSGVGAATAEYEKAKAGVMIWPEKAKPARTRAAINVEFYRDMR